ncbi:MAG: hypothetical protein ABR522_13145 [Marinobacter sp.]
MESDRREHISAVINFFWGEGTTAPESVNDGMAAVAYEALEEAQHCSPFPMPGPVQKVISAYITVSASMLKDSSRQ